MFKAFKCLILNLICLDVYILSFDHLCSLKWKREICSSGLHKNLANDQAGDQDGGMVPKLHSFTLHVHVFQI